jgi:hypothetical protein
VPFDQYHEPPEETRTFARIRASLIQEARDDRLAEEELDAG